MHGDDIRTRKAVIIGAGRVGSHVALCLMFQHLVNEIVFWPLASATPSPSAWASTPIAPTPTS